MKKKFSIKKRFFISITELPTNFRKLILVFIDISSLTLVVFFSNFLLNQISFVDIKNVFSQTFFLTIISIPIYFFSGQYKGITKFSTTKDIYYCFLRNIATIVIFSFFTKISYIYLFAIALTQAFSSYFIRNWLSNYISLLEVYKQKKVVIYGAGLAGAKLANTLILNKENNILFFVDDNPELWTRSLLGISIKKTDYLEKYNNEIDILYLAIPTLNQKRKKEIFNKIYKYKFKVLIVPSLEEIISGQAKISETRSIKIEDLIYRDIAKTDHKSIKKSFTKKTILITGAGGSIGKEISMQILKINPKRIIFVDFCEFNLYSLKNHILKKFNQDIQLSFILGDCCNKKLIDSLFNKYKIDILIHSAAYKHVPLVEENPLIGLSNNILSTNILTEAAIKHKIEKAVLISTDKAVRPTNVMGASKRVAELIFLNSQNLINSKGDSKNTKFLIVRFGNVLGSSGSVVPLFNNQIKNGGPITITHPNMTRFFMTIEEATILVLEAASFSKGGELFLLDMGEPIKILDLAKKIIELNGLKIKNENEENGDIEIKFIGLREGEKLFEELLIDGKVLPTPSEYIFKTNEKEKNYDEYKTKIDDLIINIKQGKEQDSIDLMKKIVPEWKISKYLNS